MQKFKIELIVVSDLSAEDLQALFQRIGYIEPAITVDSLLVKRIFADRKTIVGEILEDQKQWIVDHGIDEAGYVARYGSKNDPEHSGEGGEDIYKADMATLRRIEDSDLNN
jgi:hypothetical protein